MREAIGGSQILLIVITIIIVTMMLLAGSIGYTKAFKARNAILNIVQSNGAYGQDAVTFMEKSDAEDEIANILQDMGYNVKIGSSNGCRKKKEFDSLQKTAGSSISSYSCWQSQQYNFSIYTIYDNNGGMRYGVETYMYFELPLFGKTDIFSFPLYSESYNFVRTQSSTGITIPNTGSSNNNSDQGGNTSGSWKPSSGTGNNNTNNYLITSMYSSKTTSSITLNITVNSSHEIIKYEYKKGLEDYVQESSTSKKFDGLNSGTPYNVCVRVTTSDNQVQEKCSLVKTLAKQCGNEENCTCSDGALSGSINKVCRDENGNVVSTEVVGNCIGSCSSTGDSSGDSSGEDVPTTCPTTSASAYCGCLYPKYGNIYSIDATNYRTCVNNAPSISSFVVTGATSSSISVKATATNATKYEFKINSGGYTNNGTTNTYTFNNLTQGSHTVYVRVTNSFGFTVEKSLSVSTTCLSNIGKSCGTECGTGTYKSCGVSTNGTCSCSCSASCSCSNEGGCTCSGGSLSGTVARVCRDGNGNIISSNTVHNCSGSCGPTSGSGGSSSSGSSGSTSSGSGGNKIQCGGSAANCLLDIVNNKIPDIDDLNGDGLHSAADVSICLKQKTC